MALNNQIKNISKQRFSLENKRYMITREIVALFTMRDAIDKEVADLQEKEFVIDTARTQAIIKNLSVTVTTPVNTPVNTPVTTPVADVKKCNGCRLSLKVCECSDNDDVTNSGYYSIFSYCPGCGYDNCMCFENGEPYTGIRCTVKRRYV
jgi:Pyruvate/2-oxoacid:ferredoxin oxidoreductase delta subunit